MKNAIILLCLLSTQVIYGQEKSELIDNYVSSYVETNDFSGGVLIAENDGITYENYFGFANHNFKVPNSKETKFKIGSVSKQFTAAAILIMEQEGLLKTEDTISTFFPDFSAANGITIHQLLTHTSGLTDIYNITDFNKLSCQKISISDLSKFILESELNFEPGSQYQYSNGGYAILAEIIEKVSKQSYQNYLNEKVFTPLNMQHTGHPRGYEVIPNLSVGYDPVGYARLKITEYLDPELLKGSGSLYSTTHDMLIWINSIKNSTLLSPESYEKFLKNYDHNYGYGLSLYRSFDQNVFGHDGRVNGYIADYLHYKKSNHTILILGNIQTGVVDFFRRDIAAIVFGKDYKSKAKTIPAFDEPVSKKNEILGVYGFGPNFKVYIEEIDGTIQARANEGGNSELIQLKDQRFFNRTLYSYIEFVENEEGKIVKMIWTNNDGNSFEGVKE